jgi:hypothetical protein
MEKSRKLAAIVGPVLTVMVASELKAWNPTLYHEQITPLVYLSGVLLFTAGISIIRSHHIWVPAWPVLITVVGWASVMLGIYRAFFPQVYRSNFENGISAFVVEIVLLIIGVFLTFKGYQPSVKQDRTR